MSLREFAKVFEIPTTTVWRAIYAVGLRPERVGRTLYLSWADVLTLSEWFEKTGYGRRSHDAPH